MDHELIHINVTAFPVGVERVINPALRDRPVVIAAENSARAVVLALSREAYLEGVKKGMPVAAARKFCRGLKVVPPHEPLYRRAGEKVFELVSAYSPLVEPWRPGHLHVDLTGTRRLFGPAVDTGSRIRREIQERFSLRSTVGVAVNKLVSRVASRLIRPRGVCDVFPGGEAAFLAPLEVEVLPGVGRETETKLADLNLRRVGEVASLKVEHLALAFGREAYRLHRFARGIDESPVRPPERTLLIREEETLGEDHNDDRVIQGVLYLLVERAGRRLRQLERAARAVRLEIIYSDHVSARAERRLHAATALDSAVAQAAQDLLERAWTRRLRLRYLALTLADLGPGVRQRELFDEENIQREQGLLVALDAIRARFGEKALRYGRTLETKGPTSRKDAAEPIRAEGAGYVSPGRKPWVTRRSKPFSSEGAK